MTTQERKQFADAADACYRRAISIGLDMGRAAQILQAIETDQERVADGLEQWMGPDMMLYCIREMRKALCISE